MIIIDERNNRIAATSAKKLFVSVMVLLCTLFSAVSDAGIGRVGIVSGRITQFGSIFVNNREIEIANAAIMLDGRVGSEDDLKLGQVVIVRGLMDDTLPVGEATEVSFGDNVEGPITGIDEDEERLTVLGQSVLTDAQTVFDLQSGRNSFDELDLNEQVEVSGFITAKGEVLASRIEQKATGGQHEVTGIVNDLTATTFTINALTVDFSGAEWINFSTGGIVKGDIAEVKGTDFGTNGELIASRVELQDGISGEFGELGEFEGLISNFDSLEGFSVAGIEVSTSSVTTFVGGGPGNLTENVSVEVSGKFDVEGVLAASKVIIRGTRIRIHAQVDSIAVDSLTSLGITASVDDTTDLDRIGPKKANALDRLAFLYPGDYVEVRSFKNPDAGIPFLAERVKRVDPESVDLESDTLLQGFVDFASKNGFRVHGVEIDVQDARFADANDKGMDPADFFKVLETGTFVKVTGAESTGLSNGVIADEVALQLND